MASLQVETASCSSEQEAIIYLSIYLFRANAHSRLAQNMWHFEIQLYMQSKASVEGVKETNMVCWKSFSFFLETILLAIL